MLNEFSYSISYGSTLAVTTAEVKEHIRLTHSLEDSVLAIYIKSAQRYIEEYCNICLIGGTVTQIFYNGWPDHYYSLSVGNVSAVTSISYNTIDDVASFTTVSSTEYLTDKAFNRARIFPLNDGWPDAAPTQVKIIYTSGWADAASVPAEIKEAIFLIVADMYENRQDTVKQLPTASQMLLQPYRCMQIV